MLKKTVNLKFFLVFQVKYPRIWLLLASIMLHIICMLFSLGALIIVNCISATKYYVCSATFEPKTVELVNEKESICSLVGMKYFNIGIILLGALCVVFFLNFFFKLVNVFNYVHAVPHHPHPGQQRQFRT